MISGSCFTCGSRGSTVCTMLLWPVGLSDGVSGGRSSLWSFSLSEHREGVVRSVSVDLVGHIRSGALALWREGCECDDGASKRLVPEVDELALDVDDCELDADDCELDAEVEACDVDANAEEPPVLFVRKKVVSRRLDGPAASYPASVSTPIAVQSAEHSPAASSNASRFLFSPMKIRAATPVSNDVSPKIAARLASLIPCPLELRVRSPPIVTSPAIDGGPIAPVSDDPPPTLRSRTVFISRRNAAILSDGRFSVGWPVLRVREAPPYAALLIGASTGGAVCLRLARAEARKFVPSPVVVVGACGRNSGGGGGGGGGGIMEAPLLFSAS